MKYLSEYTEEPTANALNKHGGFFAFSNKQFDEAKKDGIKYVSLGSGLIAPKKNAKQLLIDIDKAYTEGIKQDIKENGIKAIIWRELANHEAQITGDISSTVFALSEYPITREDINKHWDAYYQKCIDNDWF